MIFPPLQCTLFSKLVSLTQGTLVLLRMEFKIAFLRDSYLDLHLAESVTNYIDDPERLVSPALHQSFIPKYYRYYSKEILSK